MGEQFMSLKKYLRAAVCCASIFVVQPAFAETGVTDNTITIGFFGALTGPVSLYGYPVINGAVAVYEAVNKSGGIHGRKLQFVYEDSACDAAKARAAVKRLVFTRDVFAIHGGSCSGAVAAARDVIIDSKAPFMVLTTVLDSISTPVAKNIFTTTQPASYDGATMAKFIASNPNIKKVAIVANSDDWADAHLQAIRSTLKEASIEIVSDEILERNASDATTQVLKSQQADADAVLLVTYPNEAAVFLRDANKYGLKGPFVGASSQMDMLAVAERAGGVDYVSNYFVSSYLAYPAGADKSKEYADLYAEHFPDDKLQTLSYYGMSGAYAVVDALKAAGPNLTREKFIDALNLLSKSRAGPAHCEITFSENDHQGCKLGHVWAIRGGVVTSIGETWPE
ncbi:MAG: ABC transporter substrate-binding protein [Oleispira sp.]|nr:ABC transporter substrate-binding protein [Oleispira sp.]